MFVRRFTLLRHGQSTFNARRVLNGDPTVPVPLTPEGREQVVRARRMLAGAAVDVGVCTRFPRTVETLDILLQDRQVPVKVYPELDDVDVGQFEGEPIDAYREWRAVHSPDEAPPGGESRLDALARYVAGYDRLLASGARSTLAVLHDVPIRFLLNAAHDADPIGGPHQGVPNAMPVTYEEPQLRVAVERMRERLRDGGPGT
jgi:probable phosphoglycerate mutase